MRSFVMIIAIGLCSFFTSNALAGDKESGDLKIGTSAPIFFMATYNPVASGTKRVFLDKLVGEKAQSKNKLLLLSFFEIDCKPCKKELPFWQKLHNKYKDQGLAVVVVNCDHVKEKISQAKSYVEKSGFTFPVLKDRFQALQRRYHIRSFPTTFFIDSKGKISNVRVGYNEQKRPFPLEKLQKLLGVRNESMDAPSP